MLNGTSEQILKSYSASTDSEKTIFTNIDIYLSVIAVDVLNFKEEPHPKWLFLPLKLSQYLVSKFSGKLQVV